ncbi:MAG TPA: 2-amino-3,7-dideoxy-D-threo-hept-6-ulosonate synthase [Candidatus Thermoplasmatota archaeon]|nr:2-amino-3,7-dideoxy-D-threo-hept-6-ulosonate synthase [Candidatus Thermoplasmatota archaeon]
MTSLGKRLRLRRLLGADGRGVVVPMDHGVSDGPVAGLERPAETLARVREGGADSVIVHKGLVRTLVPQLGALGFWLHVSAGTALNPDPNDKRLVASVEEALRLGADGISLHVNVGAKEESRMVEDMGRIVTECDKVGLPVLAMMYPRGHSISDPHDLALVAKVARLGYELGADVLKVPYTGSPDTFAQVVRAVDVPVLISGGPKAESDRAFLGAVHGSLAAGGAGVSVGRNLWQHKDPAAITRAVARLVHDRVSLDDALHELGKAQR